MNPQDAQKRQAAAAAVAGLSSGMVVGLGSGSTAAHAVQLIAAKVRAGELRDLTLISTSTATTRLAESLGLRVVPLEDAARVDRAVDGADEVTRTGDAIKGLGGALYEEKRVERTARALVLMVDESKVVTRLGTRAPLPIEVAKADVAEVTRHLIALGATPRLRGGDAPFVTDHGNVILDATFPGGIDDPTALAVRLDAHPAIRAHGLFLGMASELVIAGNAGVERLCFPRSGPRDLPPTDRVRDAGLAPFAGTSGVQATTPPGPHSVKARPPLEIVPAVLVHSSADLHDRLARVEGVVDRVQIDVMDGRFVPNETVDIGEIRALRSGLGLELHLMVEDPEKAIRDIAQHHAMYLVHVESLDPDQIGEALARLRALVRSLDSKLGLAVSPKTDAGVLMPHLSKLDQVLVMTVEPGFGGQALITSTLEKVRALRARAPNLPIEVDGGIGPLTIQRAVEAGANLLVAGSAVYAETDAHQAVRSLLDLARAESPPTRAP